MKKEILTTLHCNRRAEAAAFAVLGLAAMLAIEKGFSDGEPAKRWPIQRNRTVAIPVTHKQGELGCTSPMISDKPNWLATN